MNGNHQVRLVDLIENITGGLLNDTLTGNSLDNVMEGGRGDDSLAGGSGNETYVFDADQIYGTETITESILDSGHDILDFKKTTLSSITLNMGILGTVQVVNANLSLILNGEGIEEVIGGSRSDTIRGNSNNNILRGGPGNDVLDGKSGDDHLDGGAGNDDLNGGEGTDSITEVANTNFTLTDRILKRGNGETDVLDNIEIANLAGGNGANRFDLTGWTGSGSLHGGDDGTVPAANDVLVMAADANFTLSNVSLVVQFSTHTSTINLTDINSATLRGGIGNNIISATAFSGVTTLEGNEGNDTLRGGSNADTIYGGPGNDTISGNAGADNLFGGTGSDTLLEIRNARVFVINNSQLTIDPSTVIFGDEEIDSINSFESASLTGGVSANTFDISGWTSGSISINGSGGADTIRAIVSGSVILTNTGLSIAGATSTITFSSIESAHLQGSDGDDIFDASNFAGNAALLGMGGNDTLISGVGNDTLNGGAGDDRFVFRQQNSMDTDVVVGGTGIDTLDFGFFTTGISIDIANLAAQIVQAGELTIDLSAADIENVVGGAGNDTLGGNSLDNELTGNGGNDMINGAGGTDTLVATADQNMTLTNAALTVGANTDNFTNIEIARLTGGVSGNTINATAFSGQTFLEGAAGNDTLIGGSGRDQLIGGAGDDTLRGGNGDDSYLWDVDSNLGADIVDETAAAGSGADLFDFRGSALGVSVNLAITTQQIVHATNLRLTLTNGSSIEYIAGTDGADVLRGNSTDNFFLGGLGADVIDGGTGANTLFEERDGDFVLTNTSLSITTMNGGIPATETDTLVNIQSAFLSGGEGNNLMNANAFTLGAVSLSGGAGDDILIGTALDDSLVGGEGNDELYGWEGNDNLYGNDGNDLLSGGVDADLILGGDDDRLDGGNGNDRYIIDRTIRYGADRVVESASSGAADMILGLGMSGIDISLILNSVQIIGLGSVEIINPGTIEFAF